VSPYFRAADALERAVNCANLAAQAAHEDKRDLTIREALLSLAWSAIACEARKAGHGDIQITDEDRNAITAIVSHGLHTDGAHHKQWYLEQVAKHLGLAVTGYEPGVAP
jgi:hypothetical protein